MKNSAVLVFLSILLLTTPAWAGLSEEFSSWAAGPVSFLMTADELHQWQAIDEDASAEEFITVFWARRDPDPSTRLNEFKEQFDARVEAADKEFGEKETRGAMTDRGKTLILLGVPKEHTHADIGEYLARIYHTAQPPKAGSADPDAHIQMRGISFNLNKNSADLWGYSREQIPDGIEWPTQKDLITFAFFDTEGDGHFKLQLGIRKSAESVKVLREAPGALLLHPEIDHPPAFGLIPGIEPATPEELALLGTEETISEAGLFSFEGAGGPAVPVWWLVYELPSGSARAETIIGRLTEPSGEISSFKMAVSPIVSPMGDSYELTLPARSGSLDVALLEGDRPVDHRSITLEAPNFETGFLTGAFSGAEISMRSDAATGDPFVFGGYHLLPRPSGEYSSSENLAIFILLSLPEEGMKARSGNLKMRLYDNGKPGAVSPAEMISFVPAGPGVWAWGRQLPLSSFTPGHSYRIRLKIKDTESGISKESELTFRVLP